MSNRGNRNLVPQDDERDLVPAGEVNMGRAALGAGTTAVTYGVVSLVSAVPVVGGLVGLLVPLGVVVGAGSVGYRWLGKGESFWHAVGSTFEWVGDGVVDGYHAVVGK